MGQAIVDTLKSYFGYIISFFTDLAKSIKAYWDRFVEYDENFTASVIDWIKDFPLMMMESAMGLMTDFLDWAGAACSYCLGGASVGGVVSGTSQFASAIQAGYDALSPCVSYALTQSGMVSALQILSCAVAVWGVLRILSFVKSVVSVVGTAVGTAVRVVT